MDSAGLVTPPHVAGPLRLEPFRALRFAPARVGNPTTGRAFARPYREVGARLDRWRGRGLVTLDDEPALYLHEYSTAGMTVRGLVGLLDVSRRAHLLDDRAVLPHEGIHPRQADELAERMDQMRLNPAPILLVHHGPPGLRAVIRELSDRTPDIAYDDRSGQQHRLWAVRDEPTLRNIREQLSSTRALIADGHHRYAAYLRLQRRHAEAGHRTPTDHGLAMLVDQDDTPLFLGAIHRTLLGTEFDDLRDAAEDRGYVFTDCPHHDAVRALGASCLAVTDGQRWARLDLGASVDVPAVELLHRLIIPSLRHGPSGISYHHSVEDAVGSATRGSTVVLMPAPTVDLVMKVAAADRLLPEKATSFQPKPSLGVLIRSWHDAPDDPT
ncbi:DUF1015 family protein [Nocardioides sp.]|uniref:DUF1015 family protein n=1 Tax=Nocardioides sp. TaxID=35761 RepID=UPI0035166333